VVEALDILQTIQMIWLISGIGLRSTCLKVNRETISLTARIFCNAGLLPPVNFGRFDYRCRKLELRIRIVRARRKAVPSHPISTVRTFLAATRLGPSRRALEFASHHMPA
jgi:hypothetical protein